MENPEFTCYDRSFAKDPGYTGSILNDIYTDIKNANKNKINHIMVSFAGTGKMQPPRHLAKLSIWRGGIGIFDIDSQLN